MIRIIIMQSWIMVKIDDDVPVDIDNNEHKV